MDIVLSFIVMLIDSKHKQHDGIVYTTYQEAKEYVEMCLEDNYCDIAYIGTFENKQNQNCNITLIEEFKKNKKR